MCEQNNEVSVGHIGGEQDAGAGDSHCCLLHDEGTKGVIGQWKRKGVSQDTVRAQAGILASQTR